MQDPSTVYQPEADRIKQHRRQAAMCREAAQGMPPGAQAWAFHFLLRDTSSGEQVCPDLINDCSAGGNSGQTWISAPWHALMGMATELELGMLQKTQTSLAPVTCPCPCLTLALPPRTMEYPCSCLQVKMRCTLPKCRSTACVGVRCTGKTQSF